MRRIQGILVLLLAAIIFPGSLISVPLSDAFMAAVSATLAMIGLNSLLGGVPYDITMKDASIEKDTPASEKLQLTSIPRD